MYVPPRFGDGFFFFFFFLLFLRRGGGGAMKRILFENGIYVTLNVDNRGL